MYSWLALGTIVKVWGRNVGLRVRYASYEHNALYRP